jgi:hypothetical protein
VGEVSDPRPDYSWPDLFTINSAPDAVLDRETYVQIVPVARACELVAAFPNGYFGDHLTPMELYALAMFLTGKSHDRANCRLSAMAIPTGIATILRTAGSLQYAAARARRLGGRAGDVLA